MGLCRYLKWWQEPYRQQTQGDAPVAIWNGNGDQITS